MYKQYSIYGLGAICYGALDSKSNSATHHVFFSAGAPTATRFRRKNDLLCFPLEVCCLLTFAFCLLPIAYCLLPIAYCLLPIAYCLVPYSRYRTQYRTCTFRHLKDLEWSPTRGGKCYPRWILQINRKIENERKPKNPRFDLWFTMFWMFLLKV